MESPYLPKALREKWQAYWEENQTFRAPNPGEPDFNPSKPKAYVLGFFPYPSGTGLHIGHGENYTATDIFARFHRMRGYNVLHPTGWDAFGLPAEQYAIETGRHPREATTRNIDNFRRQFKRLGIAYDWGREFATTDEAYYKWTQWIFLQIFNSWYDDERRKARPIADLPIPDDVKSRGDKAVREYVDARRLAYLAEVPVNWCPALGTVLANEEVTNEGRSERGDHPVYKRPLKQWMLRITKYADRLAEDLEELDWPESIKLMQRNWIGRSEGAQVKFRIEQSRVAVQSRNQNLQSRDRQGAGSVDSHKNPLADARGSERQEYLEIYTTRPDTLFGATYMVLAPEHPLVKTITTADRRAEVEAYCAAATQRSDLARTAESREKTGVFTGAYAINPVYPEGDARARIPIWVADYVLMSYGTGAIMAVPAGDTRDFEFAKKFNLPITAVVRPPADWLHEQILRRGADMEYAQSLGLTQQADLLMKSAASAATTLNVTCLDTFALLDGDASWMQQVAYPLYEQAPGLFHEAFVDEGTAINSGPFNGLPTAEFKKRIVAWLEERGAGRGAVNYKLRDWLFSRQRYWGEPIPILHGPDGELVPLDDSELPLTLPEMDDFRPVTREENDDSMPEPPLGRAKDWAVVTRRGKTYKRELNTMPQWAGSCWYYLRFCDPWNAERFVGAEAERYWMCSLKKDGRPHAGGVDLYMGGAEHAVLHLLYARFWHKVLYDLGHVSTPEPFGKLFNQGMIRAFAYRDERGVPVGYDEIDFREDGAHRKSDGRKLVGTVEKMSKSLRNVINPDEVVAEYGADSLRLYEMFMGPLEASKPWNPRDVPGVFRFLQRTWRLIVDEDTGALSSFVVRAATVRERVQADGEMRQTGQNPLADARGSEETDARGSDKADPLERALHKTIKKVTHDVERMAFNTAISAMMEFVNEAYRAKSIRKDQAERFVLLLSVFAPHIGEELWQRLRGDEWSGSVSKEPWPTWDEKLATDDEVEIPVQVGGKVVTRIIVPRDAGEEAVRAAALAHPRVAERLSGRQVAKTIFIPGRLLNLVVK